MNWIYKGLPDTDREVLVAFTTPDHKQGQVSYIIGRRGMFKKDEWSLPDQWKVFAWADFPRLRKDVDGNWLSHHWIDIEGLPS